jgi:alpha,alpha-trehalose phosphorylase
MRDFDGTLSFDPRLPSAWHRLKFPIRFHARQIHVDITHDLLTFELVEGDPITITVLGSEYTLEPDEPLEIPAVR